MNLNSVVTTIPDFPKPGILFRDISPVMADPEKWRVVIGKLTNFVEEHKPNMILGIESRGFIIGASLATSNEIGFLPIRKAGKLPGNIIGINYELEYGSDRLEINQDLIIKGTKVMIIDDLLATGGTARASYDLVKKAGGNIVGFGFIIELMGLEGRYKLPEEIAIESVIQYQ